MSMKTCGNSLFPFGNNEMKKVLKLILMSFIVLFNGLVAADDLPIIMWGSQIQHRPAIALKFHDGTEFMDVLREHSTADTITFVIAEDQLSVEDFSQCKSPNGQTCFKGIQKIESKLYLPNVEDPASIIEKVAELNAIEVNLLSSGNFSEPLNHRTGQYIFVKLDDDDSIAETKSMTLTRHDQMIMRFYDDFLLRNDLDVMVVLTGKQASHNKRVAREAFYPYYDYVMDSIDSTNSTNVSSAAENFVGFIWKTEPVLLYYISMDVEEWSESRPMNVTDVNVIPHPTDNATKKNATSRIAVTELVVTMSEMGNNSFEFHITIKYGSWRADQFRWNDEPLFADKLISAPDGFSYHCSPEIRIANKNQTIVVTWEGLQIEPKFDYVEGGNRTSFRFSDSYDCVGFVSVVILSVLLVTFMLLFVLFIGISCLLNIKPFDQFDNPKGKTITVTVDG